MTSTPILGPDAIVADLDGRDRDSVLVELCVPLSRSEGVPLDELVAALRERETLASTAVGNGVAMPHGVHPGLRRVAASFGRSATALEWGAPDGEAVRLFVALVRPPDAANAHLKALARWSQVLVVPATREALLTAATAHDIHRILSERSPQL